MADEEEINTVMTGVLTGFYSLDNDTMVQPFLENFATLDVFTTVINGGSISTNGVLTHADDFDWTDILAIAYAAFETAGIDTTEILDYAIIQTAYMTVDYFLYRDFYGNLDYEVDEESVYGTKLHIVTAVA